MPSRNSLVVRSLAPGNDAAANVLVNVGGSEACALPGAPLSRFLGALAARGDTVLDTMHERCDLNAMPRHSRFSRASGVETTPGHLEFKPHQICANNPSDT